MTAAFSQSPVRRGFLEDLRDPTVWKYSAYSLFLAAGALIWIGHFVIDRAVHLVLDALSVQRWVPESLTAGVSVASFVLSIGVFSLVWPLLASVFLPVMTFFQVLLTEPFARQFCAEKYPDVAVAKSMGWHNLLVFFKWTSLKGIVFLLFLPLLHVPGLGWVLHLILVSAWITLIFRDITAHRFLGNAPMTRRPAARLNLVGMVALGSIANFLVVWLIGVLSLSLPHFRQGFLIAGAAFVIVGNYLMIAEFLRSSAEFVRQDLRAAELAKRN